MTTKLALSILPLLLLAAAAAPSLEPADAVAAHQQLATATFSAETPVPAGATSFTRDVASWRLETGTVRLQKPLADGAVTGAVLTGRGSFRIEVPDRVERAQLTRFTGKPEQPTFEIAFDHLLLRAPGGVDRLLGAEAAAPWSPEPLALERRNRWRDQQLHDADARVVAGLLIPGDDYLWVDMHTADRGWISFELEPWRQEELAVDHWEGGFPYRVERPTQALTFVLAEHALELGGDKQGTVVVLVDQPEERFEIPVPAAPKKVSFAPGDMVLARVERW